MLTPDDRTLLLDALRPPEGTRLDRAIGTTYTLDLQALLTAPLAFALFDWALGDEGTPNVVAILEGLRRYADRTTIFCQAGEIRIPRKYQPALTFLEERVVPVTPTDPDRIFHPKVWILRFLDEPGGPARYRVLCASRNLTFDRSWDTLLAVEGVAGHAGRGDPDLVAFVRQLTALAPASRDDITSSVSDVAEELEEVVFTPPEGFDDLRFHSVTGGTWPFPTDAERSLVVSPYLTAGALERLRSPRLTSDVLISRAEALDRTPTDGWHQRYVLSPLVVQPDALTAADDGALAGTDEVDLRGLHAKLFLFEEGDVVRLFTGSANATDAAFAGNVELLAELVTTPAVAGIDRLLAHGEGEPAFRDLLEEHPPAVAAEPVDEVGEHLERALDATRRRLGALRYTASYQLDGDDLYDLDLEAAGQLDLPDGIRSIRCWRISAGPGHAVTVRPQPEGFHLRFGHVSGPGITAFFAFEVTAAAGGRTEETSFVVTAQLVGAPEGRRQRVLTDLLRSRGDVLRYLLFLLADLEGGGFEELAAALAGEGAGAQDRRIDPAGTPLLESLLAALRHDPARLDHVASLLEELKENGRDGDLLPEGLDAVWQPIWDARQGLVRR